MLRFRFERFDQPAGALVDIAADRVVGPGKKLPRRPVENDLVGKDGDDSGIAPEALVAGDLRVGRSPEKKRDLRLGESVTAAMRAQVML